MADLAPRNFLQPCLLPLLAERADHGYELAGSTRVRLALTNARLAAGQRTR